MTQTVADAIAEKGGRLEPQSLGEAAAGHIEQAQRIFEGYLKPILVSDPASPLVRATPPSRVSQFEFVRRWDVNAWAILAEERPLILFHAGVPFSLFELFNSLLARNEVLADLFGETEPEAGAFSRPKLDYSYVESNSWPGMIPSPDGSMNQMVGWRHYLPSKPHTQIRGIFASQAYAIAMHFLFCHELGHIDRGHLELRNRRANSFALHEVSYARPPSAKLAAFDAKVLQALETDADMYALSQVIKPFHPKAIEDGIVASLGERKSDDPECHRLFLFSIGVLFLCLEYQQGAKHRGLNVLKKVFGDTPTHPSSFGRIDALMFVAHLLVRGAALEQDAMLAASAQALRDLAKVAELLGMDPKRLIEKRNSTPLPLWSQLNELQAELTECSTITRQRYYRDGKRVTYAEGRRNAEDVWKIRGQGLILYVDGKEIHIPFLEEDAPIQAFLENSSKWEDAGYIDNAGLFALLATVRDPQSEAARARLTAIRTNLGRHAAAFDELLAKYGHKSHLADRLLESVKSPAIRTKPEQALEVLETLAVLRPRNVSVRLQLGDCRSLLKDFPGAAREYDQALAQSDTAKERIHAFVGLGNCAADGGQTESAVEWFKKALTIDGSNTYALRNLGLALVRGGRPEEAVPYFERALEAAPSDALLWFECACGFHACRQFDKAREHVVKAIALAPDVERYRQALEQLDRMS